MNCVGEGRGGTSTSDHHKDKQDVLCSPVCEPATGGDEVAVICDTSQRLCVACCSHESPEVCKTEGCMPHEAVKTRISVRNICCDAEVRLIDRILKPMKGVEDVKTNALTKLVMVTHCPVDCCASVEHLVDSLNAAHLGATLLSKGEDSAAAARPSATELAKEHAKWLHAGVVWALFIAGTALYQHEGAADITFIVACALGSVPILQKAVRAGRKLRIDMSVLMMLAVGGALGSGEYLEAALVVALFLSAELIEHAAMNRVTRALSTVMQLSVTRTATRAKDGKTVPIGELVVGDVVSLRPGEESPIDGRVRAGFGSVSEASMTGEAIPIEKRTGSTIIAGSVMLNGFLEVELTALTKDSTIEKIKEQVEEAQAQKGRAQVLVDTFAKFWTPTILIAVGVMVGIVPFATKSDAMPWLEKALVLLVLACPCALVLAAPIPTTCTIAAAARNGVLIKRAEVVEQLASVSAVALDKTGTLTKGEFAVVCAEDLSENGTQVEATLKLAAAIESKSAHPVAAAVVSRAVGCAADAYETGGLPQAKKFRNLEGVGVRGEVDVGGGVFKPVVAGNKKALGVAGAPTRDVERFETFQAARLGDTTLCVVVDGRLCLGIALNDTLRPDARRAVDLIRSMGCSVAMLTGDAEAAARQVAGALDLSDYQFSLLPQDKHAWVQLKEKGGARTLMLGDGINDANALAAATVGIAMGETSMALAARTADIVIMSSWLSRLPQAMQLCRYARRLVAFNIVFAAGVKLVAVVLALLGKLHLWMAVLVDVGSLVIVLLVGASVLGSTTLNNQGQEESLVKHTSKKEKGSEEV